MLGYRKPFVWFSKCQKFRLKWIVSPCWLFITELIWMDYIQDQLPPHVFLGAEFCYDAFGPLKLFQHLIMIYYTRTGTGALWIFAFEHTLKVDFSERDCIHFCDNKLLDKLLSIKTPCKCKREILSQQCNNAHVMPIFVQKCVAYHRSHCSFQPPSCIKYAGGGCKSCIGVFLVHMRPLEKKIAAADIRDLPHGNSTCFKCSAEDGLQYVSLGLNRGLIYKPTLMYSFQFSCPAVLSSPPSNFLFILLNFLSFFPPTMLLNFVPT